jgi:hypothetical protein
MINTMIERLNDEIQKAQLYSCPEKIEEASAKLQTVNRLWQKFCTDPLILDMQKVVRKMVKSYHSDFYELDLSRMEKIGKVPFCWFVRDHGTDLLPLEGEEAMINNAESWFNAIRTQYTDGVNVNDTQRLYICDPTTKTMKRLKTFSGIQFRATATAVDC